mmetsp:Transcript_3514/g.4670  ORF Transcript_3514/g.4670 Transcript_3514/m.4670 type:complete len:509 (-) Transcript_3514:55-1581(-)
MPPQTPFDVGTETNLIPCTFLSESDTDSSEILQEEKNVKLLFSKDLFKISVSSDVWGYPGYLTQVQFEVLEKFREIVHNSSDDFRATIFIFNEAHEDEFYALCRWLRSYKFNLNKTIKKAEEATNLSSEARKKNFYHSPNNPSLALGVEPSIFLKHFPQFFHGMSKKGCPIFYAKAGTVNIKAIENITTSEGIIKFHWHEMYHNYNREFKEMYERMNDAFRPYEIIYVLDLEHLNSAQLSKQLISVVKTQCHMDETVFPDAMSKMFIINAPSTFALLWKVVRGWIDPRNATKVEILGPKKSLWKARLREFIDMDQLPSDYGGYVENDTSEDIMRKQMIKQYKITNPAEEAVREEQFMFSPRQNELQSLIVEKGRTVSLSIFTKSKNYSIFTVTDMNGKKLEFSPGRGFPMNHTRRMWDCRKSTRSDLERINITLKDPGQYIVQISSIEKSNDNFLVVFTEFKVVLKDESQRKATVLNKGRASSLGVGTFHVNDCNDRNDIDFTPYWQS